MKIKIIFDNNVMDDRFRAGWGLSVLVDEKVLFDTGEDAESLLYNMKEMGVKLDELDAVVISHDHWDHTGGLREVLKRRKGIKVYACPGFSEEFKKSVRELGGDLIEPCDFVEIRRSVYVTGVIRGDYKTQPIEEQALAVKTPKGITVVTGCAHPGVVMIVEKVKEEFAEEKVYCVFGGFHLKDKRKDEIDAVVRKLEALGVENVGPAHCSGAGAANIFRKKFKTNYIPIAAGKIFEV
jgi:7,8-dihydropterin-6-yl-methyl-4-(beta-D-ribofuranosyl)aminobenzene 5'-phosphate synthase